MNTNSRHQSPITEEQDSAEAKEKAERIGLQNMQFSNWCFIRHLVLENFSLIRHFRNNKSIMAGDFTEAEYVSNEKSESKMKPMDQLTDIAWAHQSTSFFINCFKDLSVLLKNYVANFVVTPEQIERGDKRRAVFCTVKPNFRACDKLKAFFQKHCGDNTYLVCVNGVLVTRQRFDPERSLLSEYKEILSSNSLNSVEIIRKLMELGEKLKGLFAHKIGYITPDGEIYEDVEDHGECIGLILELDNDPINL